MDTVRIFDTTLRDGEQSPGATLTLPEKVEIARHLESMGVDIIEAGFPIASEGDFESVKAIASQLTKSTVCGLARGTPKDIDRAGEAVKDAAKSRVHVFLATSKIHREHKLRKGKEDIVKLAIESIKQALQYTKDVEFSPEDASRTELEFLEEITQAAIEAGATTINLPDTVGYATPKTYGEIFSHLIKKLPAIRERRIVLSAHCHDDLGMAVPNSLSGVENGARQVECTINGIGERAGNAALEEIVMALRTRSDYFKVGSRIDTTNGRVDARADLEVVGARPQRHDDLLQCRVAGALADAVDGALDLPRAVLDPGQGIGDGHAEVVVAVGAEDDPPLADRRELFDQVAEDLAIGFRRGVADGVGEVDRRRAGLDRRLRDLLEEFQLRSAGVLGAELDVLRVL